jgi:hypothetical protein
MQRWRLPGMPMENRRSLRVPASRRPRHRSRCGRAFGRSVLELSQSRRLCLPGETVVFELDLPELLEQKQAILEHQNAASSCCRVLVRADLVEDGWPRALTATGSTARRPPC